MFVTSENFDEIEFDNEYNGNIIIKNITLTKENSLSFLPEYLNGNLLIKNCILEDIGGLPKEITGNLIIGDVNIENFHLKTNKILGNLQIENVFYKNQFDGIEINHPLRNLYIVNTNFTYLTNLPFVEDLIKIYNLPHLKKLEFDRADRVVLRRLNFNLETFKFNQANTLIMQNYEDDENEYIIDLRGIKIKVLEILNLKLKKIKSDNNFFKVYFYNCNIENADEFKPKIKKIEIDELNSNSIFENIKEVNELILKEAKIKKLIIKNNIEKIEIKNSEIEEIEFNDNLKHLKKFSIINTPLKKVNLPNNVRYFEIENVDEKFLENNKIPEYVFHLKITEDIKHLFSFKYVEILDIHEILNFDFFSVFNLYNKPTIFKNNKFWFENYENFLNKNEIYFNNYFLKLKKQNKMKNIIEKLADNKLFFNKKGASAIWKV